MTNEIQNLTDAELIAVYRIGLMSKQTIGNNKAENTTVLELAKKEITKRKLNLKRANNPKFRNAECFVS